jgi:lipase maturation factor 1
VAGLAFASWRSWGDKSRGPRYRRTRSVLLRGLGVVYLSAFASLAVQLDGLIGSRGILPAAEYLAQARRFLGPGLRTYWRLPTLLWLDSSDRALHLLCGGGMAVGIVLIAGILPGLSSALLWLFYLSLVVAGQVFLGYQWDSLLLEAGLLAVLLAPWGFRLGRAGDQPWAFAVWLFRWLLFRLVFLSGVVKLASRDPVWWNWTALEYHYQTQPLPCWTSWYIHQMPSWFHWLSVGFMFYAELIAPFFVFGPRPVRLAGCASLVLLQVLIAATGNYGFFNVLAVVLCLALLEDRDWSSLQVLARRGWVFGRLSRPRRSPDRDFDQAPASGQRDLDQGDDWAPGRSEPTEPEGLRSWSWPRQAVVGVVGATLIAVTAAEMIDIVWPEVIVPTGIETLRTWLAPFRSANTYGLFAVMTTERPEIIVEGSDDGVSWKPYRFRWKPCELDRRPRFTTPHLPRLDWQMWFAALAGNCRSAPWFLRFEHRLRSGTPEVLGLLRENPFPAHPPRYVRARLFLYKFTQWGSNDWWTSEEIGLFCSPLE